MLKYVDTKVTFTEIPDNITLCINISGCINNCEGCHSPYLKEDIGTELDLQHLTDLIDANNGITCVCIMGGDQDVCEVNDILESIKEYYPELKTGWYSGRASIPKDLDLLNVDFLKLGPFDMFKGPLNRRTTNQRMYEVNHEEDNKLIDVTHKFWK